MIFIRYIVGNCCICFYYKHLLHQMSCKKYKIILYLQVHYSARFQFYPLDSAGDWKLAGSFHLTFQLDVQIVQATSILYCYQVLSSLMQTGDPPGGWLIPAGLPAWQAQWNFRADYPPEFQLTVLTGLWHAGVIQVGQDIG